MHCLALLLFLAILFDISTCRDFYMGMFKKNDLLVAHDTLHKERLPFRFSFAKYGKQFNCPITYVRVEDRLNIGRGPRVNIIRGGLRKKFIVMRLTSPYNNPLSVNIFIGCENKKFTNPPWKIIRPTKTTKLVEKETTTPVLETTIGNEVDGNATTVTVGEEGGSTTVDDVTGTVPAGGETTGPPGEANAETTAAVVPE